MLKCWIYGVLRKSTGIFPLHSKEGMRRILWWNQDQTVTYSDVNTRDSRAPYNLDIHLVIWVVMIEEENKAKMYFEGGCDHSLIKLAFVSTGQRFCFKFKEWNTVLFYTYIMVFIEKKLTAVFYFIFHFQYRQLEWIHLKCIWMTKG